MSDDTTANGADRDALEKACLEGLIETKYGYKYRPSKGADAVERILAARVAPLLAERDALRAGVRYWRERAEDAERLMARSTAAKVRERLAALDAPAAAQPEPCPIAAHTPPCDCAALLAQVTTHVRTSTERGPDYCRPCSEAVREWVVWPCSQFHAAQPDAGVRERVLALADEWAAVRDPLGVTVNTLVMRQCARDLRVAVESATTHPTTPHESDQGERGRA